jgi:hypothetical protein
MKTRSMVVIGLAVCLASAPALAAGARPRMMTPQAALAVKRGLVFLAKAQHKRGSWSGGTGYGSSYEAAMTGLAGVALLSSGSTPTRGPYSQNIRRAIYWVLSQQNRATGLICSRAEESRSMYGHGFCTLFLAESLGMCGDKKLENRIRTALQKAIKLIEGSQSPMGGWIYTPSGRSDEGSVTVTQVQALRACQNAGVQVNKKLIDSSFGYLLKAKTSDGGIAYRANPSGKAGGRGRPALAAAAWTCLNSAGRYNDPLTKAVRGFCLKNYERMLKGGGHYYYTHLYLAEAMYQHGGKTWNIYFPKIRQALLKKQAQNGAWQGDSVGSIYGTAIALTILQLPYGYFPVVQR